MTEQTHIWPYPTVPVNGKVTIDEEGENQTCECGNDSWTSDWRHADHDGRLTVMHDGSADPAGFAVCPGCGRMYSNATLFTAADSTAPATARYDTTSAEFGRATGRLW